MRDAPRILSLAACLQNGSISSSRRFSIADVLRQVQHVRLVDLVLTMEGLDTSGDSMKQPQIYRLLDAIILWPAEVLLN